MLSPQNSKSVSTKLNLNQKIQPKLTINAPGDAYEQEADAMAERVMRMPDFSKQGMPPKHTSIIGASIQRKCATCEEEEKRKPIMRKESGGFGGMQVSNSFSSTLNSTKGSGTILPSGTRDFMENAFSTDFSGVRIHADSQANNMSQSIQAKAFTHGSDIYFGAGQYNPNSVWGKTLLAHELTHTVQQGGAIERKIQRYDNCTTAQNRMIDSGLTRAKRRSTRAIAIVSEIQAGNNAGAATLLRRYFGTLTAGQITTVHDRMVAADVRLNNAAVWQCDTAATYPQCGGTDNWCAGTLCPEATQPTHLCPPVFQPESDHACAEPSRAMLLIHEALRSAGACGGFLPPGNRTPPDSLTNVYSYTQFMANYSASR
jgi:hypothetical protein